MRVLGLLLYVLAAGTVAFGLFEVWNAKVWGYGPLDSWLLFLFLALIVFALVQGGRSLRSQSANMRRDQLVARLQSSLLSERMNATYELDYDDFSDARVLDAVRSNLDSDEPNLLDITIMRLLVRGKDAQSAERVLEILKTTREELVFSAGVHGLWGLAQRHPEAASATLRELEALRRSDLSSYDAALLRDAVAAMPQLEA